MGDMYSLEPEMTGRSTDAMEQNITIETYSDGSKRWRIRSGGRLKYHRTDGPAVVYSDGGVYWFLNGIHISFDRWLDQNTILTGEEKVMMKLQYG
jgi:hypothetical protein